MSRRLLSPALATLLHMALLAYYDGSGKTHDSRFVTLAGVAAPDYLWPVFEARWKEVLQRHRLNSWHTSAAMSHRPERRQFVEPEWRDQWNRRKASVARTELMNLLLSSTCGGAAKALQLLTCTVDIRHYSAAKRENPHLRPPEAICVNTCVGRLQLHDPAARIRLCFDRNESFLRQVKPVWEKDRSKAWVPWARQVEAITAGIAREEVALQAADLLAWEVTRVWKTAGLPFLLPINGLVCRLFDGQAIRRTYPPEREAERSAGIRRAGRKTERRRRRGSEQPLATG